MWRGQDKDCLTTPLMAQSMMARGPCGWHGGRQVSGLSISCVQHTSCPETVIAGTRRDYTTALRAAASRKNDALSFGVRFCVVKSTYTSPNRVPKPSPHSKLSIRLHWK
jgi:hypothetical protein